MPSPPESPDDKNGELASGPAEDPDGGWCNGVNGFLFRCERIMDHRSAKGVAVPLSLLLFSPLGEFAIVDTGQWKKVLKHVSLHTSRVDV
jgi:hypothetical protein